MKESEKDKFIMKFIKSEVTVGEVLMTISMMCAAVIWLVEGRVVGKQNTDAIAREVVARTEAITLEAQIRRDETTRLQKQLDKMVETESRLTENQNLVGRTLERLDQWRQDHDKPIPH